MDIYIYIVCLKVWISIYLFIINKVLCWYVFADNDNMTQLLHNLPISNTCAVAFWHSLGNQCNTEENVINKYRWS